MDSASGAFNLDWFDIHISIRYNAVVGYWGLRQRLKTKKRTRRMNVVTIVAYIGFYFQFHPLALRYNYF